MDKFTDTSDGTGVIVTTVEGISFDGSDADGLRRALRARAEAEAGRIEVDHSGRIRETGGNESVETPELPEIPYSPVQQISLWAHGGSYMDVARNADGGFTMHSQTIHEGGESEYALTVEPEDVGAVLKALQAETGADVLEVMRAHAEQIESIGAKSWLEGLGIRPEFWNRLEFDH